MKKLITTAKFAEMLMGFILSSFADVQSETEPKINKTHRETKEPNPFTKVLNHRILNVQLMYNYEKQVNDKAEKEGLERDFEAQEHPWARKVKGALARHKNYEIDLANFDVNSVDLSKFYMAYKVQKIREQSYIADGKVIDKKELLPYFPPQKNYDNQPAEEKTAIQYMKLSSVKEFVFDGVEYRIMG